MTKEEFIALKPGMVIVAKKDATKVERWRVNGQMQGSLKTGTARWPVKHGLYCYGYLMLDKNHTSVLRTNGYILTFDSMKVET